MQQTIHETAIAKGFWRGPVDPEFVLAKLCLVHSEVSEVMEAYRKERGTEAIMTEFADVFIRLYDLIEGMYEHGLIDSNDINRFIATKAAFNATRPAMHGNLA